jgi:hypothetical protein
LPVIINHRPYIAHAAMLFLTILRAWCIMQAPEAGKLQKKTYDLDSKDFFWAKNSCKPFPEVAEEIDTELTKSVFLFTYKIDVFIIWNSPHPPPSC